MSAHLDVDVGRLGRAVVNDTRHGPYLRAEVYHHPADKAGEKYVVSETVVLRADSLERLHDWLCAAALQVDNEIAQQRREPDTDAAAADAGALA